MVKQLLKFLYTQPNTHTSSRGVAQRGLFRILLGSSGVAGPIDIVQKEPSQDGSCTLFDGCSSCPTSKLAIDPVSGNIIVVSTTQNDRNISFSVDHTPISISGISDDTIYMRFM
jgi:hypothetical protein